MMCWSLEGINDWCGIQVDLFQHMISVGSSSLWTCSGLVFILGGIHVLLRFSLVSTQCAFTDSTTTGTGDFFSQTCSDLFFILVVILSNDWIATGFTFCSVVLPTTFTLDIVHIKIIHWFFCVTKFTNFCFHDTFQRYHSFKYHSASLSDKFQENFSIKFFRQKF